MVLIPVSESIISINYCLQTKFYSVVFNLIGFKCKVTCLCKCNLCGAVAAVVIKAVCSSFEGIDSIDEQKLSVFKIFFAFTFNIKICNASQHTFYQSDVLVSDCTFICAVQLSHLKEMLPKCVMFIQCIMFKT